jgi:hypothetical protein
MSFRGICCSDLHLSDAEESLLHAGIQVHPRQSGVLIPRRGLVRFRELRPTGERPSGWLAFGWSLGIADRRRALRAQPEIIAAEETEMREGAVRPSRSRR